MKKDNEDKLKKILDELENEELIRSDEGLKDLIDEKKIKEKTTDNPNTKLSRKSKKLSKDASNLEAKEFSLQQFKYYLAKALIKYAYILILDLVIFLLLFFLIPTVILEVKPVIWMSLFLIFNILPTVALYMKKLFRKYQLMIGIPFFYSCILCILDRCTIKDLYGITSHGALDKTPAWIDALLVTFIIVFFQYISLIIVDFIKRLFHKIVNK